MRVITSLSVLCMKFSKTGMRSGAIFCRSSSSKQWMHIFSIKYMMQILMILLWVFCNPRILWVKWENVAIESNYNKKGRDITLIVCIDQHKNFDESLVNFQCFFIFLQQYKDFLNHMLKFALINLFIIFTLVKMIFFNWYSCKFNQLPNKTS